MSVGKPNNARFKWILNALSERAPWTVAKRIFRNAQITPSRGWKSTIAKLSAASATPSTTAIDQLERGFIEHVFGGEKFVTLYRIHDDAVTATLREKIGQLKTLGPIIPNNLDEAGELPAEADTISPPASERFGSVSSETTFTGVMSGRWEDGRAALVIRSTRHLEVRETIEADDLIDEDASEDQVKVVAEAMSEYDRIIGTKFKEFTAFDVIGISEDGLLELRIDFPKGSSKDQCKSVRSNLLAALKDLFGLDIAVSPINVFPAIRAIYLDNTEGRVVELGFGTSTKSIKNEKMRLGDDLRQEKYHLAGKVALDVPISPYSLVVWWDEDVEGGIAANPELSISAGVRAVTSQSPAVYEFCIAKCADNPQFERIKNVVLNHCSIPSA
jgi:hypothetical protein